MVYESGVSDRAKRTSSFLRNNTRWITVALISLAFLVTVILVIVHKFTSTNGVLLDVAGYYDISTVVICILLFINLCIGYGSTREEYYSR